MKVLRGLKNYKDVGRVLTFDGKDALDIWPEDHCNEFNGTDSTIFPPLFGPDDDIVSFGYEICRSLSARFDRPSKIKGVYKKKRNLKDLKLVILIVPTNRVAIIYAIER